MVVTTRGVGISVSRAYTNYKVLRAHNTDGSLHYYEYLIDLFQNNLYYMILHSITYRWLVEPKCVILGKRNIVRPAAQRTDDVKKVAGSRLTKTGIVGAPRGTVNSHIVLEPYR